VSRKLAGALSQHYTANRSVMIGRNPQRGRILAALPMGQEGCKGLIPIGPYRGTAREHLTKMTATNQGARHIPAGSMCSRRLIRT